MFNLLIVQDTVISNILYPHHSVTYLKYYIYKIDNINLDILQIVKLRADNIK